MGTRDDTCDCELCAETSWSESLEIYEAEFDGHIETAKGAHD